MSPAAVLEQKSSRNKSSVIVKNEDLEVSLLPSSVPHFCIEGMAAAASIIHFPSEQVVFALQGAAGENREGEEVRLKTRENEE